ncbi:MAG: hypothetical protein GY714_25250 [Desulfobacterales bacterium]|nr:hypothetical protein [Desulfobacterales bacterium]
MKKYLLFTFFIGSLFVLFTNTSIASTIENTTIPREVAEVIKTKLDGVDADDIRSLLKQKYIIFHLLDNEGNWKSPELAAISDSLLPAKLDMKDIKSFVDRAAIAAEANQYLMDFLNQASNKNFDNLFSKVESEGQKILPDVVSLAMALERLTIAMRNDWKVLEACSLIWKEAKESIDLKKYLSLFGRAKLVSVEVVIGQYIDSHKSGKIKGYAGRVSLPVNIMEAVIADFKKGNKENAAAGIVLAKSNPGSIIEDPVTGAGPTRWSDDGKAIDYYPPLPKKYADIYATWNMAYLSTYQDFPYFLTKLFIPQVNDYQENPEGYLYNRALALYSFVYYVTFQRIYYEDNGIETIDWQDQSLTSLWGVVNKESALKYELDQKK